jgi:catalase (peroxidase I)
MGNIDARLARLESLAGNSKADPVFISTGMQGKEVTVALLTGGRTFGRERGETEAAFIKRVHREAPSVKLLMRFERFPGYK